jgi:hypothetical protein
MNKGLTKAQRRLILAMPDTGAKKWRAIYRDAKVRHWTQLPFSIAKPTLTGFEYLTPRGVQIKRYLANTRTSSPGSGGANNVPSR